MIDESSVTATIVEAWDLIAGNAMAHREPTIADLPDGMRRIEARLDFGVMFAVFSVSGRALTPAEEQELVIACAIPENAERVPLLGQDRVPAYRRGIYGAWRYQVAYRWRIEEVERGA